MILKRNNIYSVVTARKAWSLFCWLSGILCLAVGRPSTVQVTTGPRLCDFNQTG